MFATAIGLASEENAEEDEEIAQITEVKRHYERAKAWVDIREHESVSTLNLESLRIKDFDAYF